VRHSILGRQPNRLEIFGLGNKWTFVYDSTIPKLGLSEPFPLVDNLEENLYPDHPYRIRPSGESTRRPTRMHPVGGVDASGDGARWSGGDVSDGEASDLRTLDLT
jgi:hypothetical protein